MQLACPLGHEKCKYYKRSARSDDYIDDKGKIWGGMFNLCRTASKTPVYARALPLTQVKMSMLKNEPVTYPPEANQVPSRRR